MSQCLRRIVVPGPSLSRRGRRPGAPAGRGFLTSHEAKLIAGVLARFPLAQRYRVVPLELTLPSKS